MGKRGLDSHLATMPKKHVVQKEFEKRGLEFVAQSCLQSKALGCGITTVEVFQDCPDLLAFGPGRAVEERDSPFVMTCYAIVGANEIFKEWDG
jgi:hypothetical protein